MYSEESLGVFGVEERKAEPQEKMGFKVRVRSECFKVQTPFHRSVREAFHSGDGS